MNRCGCNNGYLWDWWLPLRTFPSRSSIRPIGSNRFETRTLRSPLLSSRWISTRTFARSTRVDPSWKGRVLENLGYEVTYRGYILVTDQRYPRTRNLPITVRSREDVIRKEKRSSFRAAFRIRKSKQERRKGGRGGMDRRETLA